MVERAPTTKAWDAVAEAPETPFPQRASELAGNRAGPVDSGSEASAGTGPSADIGHDFSRVALHANSPRIQPRLTVGLPGDRYEQEAERIADEVMTEPEPTGGWTRPVAGPKYAVGGGLDPFAARSPTTRDEGAAFAPPIVHEVLRSPGRPLSQAAREFAEPRFGIDFSRVRIHTDSRASRSARAVDALAYTVGHDVVFGERQYRPHTPEGRRLLAHELSHVAQQERGGSAGVLQRHPIYISRHGDAAHLRNAHQFFRMWGYSPIRTGVDSIEEVLADLAQKSSIGHITLVSHAHPSQLYMAMLTGGSSGILEGEWLVGDLSANRLAPAGSQGQQPNVLTRQRQEMGRISSQLFGLERHFTTRSDLAAAKRGLHRHQPDLVQRLGDLDDSIMEQYIWWNVELYFVNRVNFTNRQKRALRTAIRQKLTEYRQTLRQGSALSGREIAAADFHALDQAVPEVLRAANYRFPNLSTQGGARSQRSHVFEQLQESPSGPLNRVLRNPDFVSNLWTVKQRMTSSSWVEVQGCRLGSEPGQLQNMRTFFSGQSAPRVSAPDWFQAYGVMSWDEVPNNPAAIGRWWRRRDVRQALTYWYPVVTGQQVPQGGLTRQDFETYLGGNNALPVGRRLLVRQDVRQDAILSWLARHQYRLSRAPRIESAFFDQGFGRGMRNTFIEYLQEQRNRRSRVIFRPDPAYQQHIVSVP